MQWCPFSLETEVGKESRRSNNNNNNNNNNQRQCLWCYPHDHGHCESSPGSFDKCRLSAGWPPTLRPSQPTWATIHIHHRHLLLLLSPKADTHFTIPRRVEGWVDLGTAGRVRNPCPIKAVHRNGCHDKQLAAASHTAVNHAIAKPLRPAEARGCKQLA